MLLRLEPPARSEELLQVTRQLVTLLIDIAQSDGEADAAGLLKRSWPSKGARPSASRVEALLGLPAEQRWALAEAAEGDADFQSQLGVDGAMIAFSSLPDRVRKAARLLAYPLYDRFQKTGFDIAAGSGPARMRRADLEAGFWESNPALTTCPACLIQRIERPLESGRSAVHFDHYLNRDSYPLLSVHPRNLVPVCASCNTVMKSNKDVLGPVGRGRAALSQVWFPYHSHGLDEASFEFRPQRVLPESVALRGHDSDGERRAQAFTALFELPERWGRMLAGVYSSAREWLAEADSEDELRSRLGEMISMEYATGRNQPGFEIKIRWLKWLHDDERALRALASAMVPGSAA
jgi:hypothetical protein